MTSRFLIKPFYRSAAALVAVLLLPFVSRAQDTDQFVDVVATGVGMTQDEAHRAAGRAAVEQVVGSMVDATTLTEKGNVVEDKILSYSPGLIADSKIIGVPKKDDDGLITVKVKATVKKTALREKLVAAKLVSVELDGESLWARMVSAQDHLADAEAMIKDVLAKHLACVVAEPVPGKTGKSPLDLDPKTGEVFANVRVRIDQEKYRHFVGEVVEKLGPMAEKNISFNGREEGSDWYFRPENVQRNPLILIENVRTMSARALYFEKNKFDAVERTFLSGKNPEVGTRLAVQATLLDGSSDVLSKTEYWLPNDNLSLCGRYGFGTSVGVICVIAPFCGGKFGPYFDLSKEKCWANRIFRISLGTLTADELKTVSRLEIKVGRMKDGQFAE